MHTNKHCLKTVLVLGFVHHAQANSEPTQPPT
jgi:hypothetical protein